jgi:hypothetical protein
MPVGETVNPGVDGFIQQSPLPEAISILYLNIDENRKTPKFLSRGPNVPFSQGFGECPVRAMPLAHSNHRPAAIPDSAERFDPPK